jgi:hypothetical protein
LKLFRKRPPEQSIEIPENVQVFLSVLQIRKPLFKSGNANEPLIIGGVAARDHHTEPILVFHEFYFQLVLLFNIQFNLILLTPFDKEASQPNDQKHSGQYQTDNRELKEEFPDYEQH